jgi:hypothetical protein
MLIKVSAWVPNTGKSPPREGGHMSPWTEPPLIPRSAFNNSQSPSR